MFALYVSEMLKPLASDVQGRAIEGAGRLLAEERPRCRNGPAAGG
jgi:hypothetical protein